MPIQIEKIVAISGRQGLYRMVANRGDGLIVEDLTDKKRSFVSGRMHQFTPLESISVFTETADGAVALKDVFQAVHDKREEHPPVAVNAPAEAIRSYFLQVLPEHNTDKVLISDIKKIVKWYNFLTECGLING